MDNRDVEAAWRYHNGTKHPNGDLLDPFHTYTRRPILFKVYEGAEQIPLEVDEEPRGVAALSAIAAEQRPGEGGEAIPDRATLARLLHYSAGITKRIDYGPPTGEIAFRAAACTGALYHIELYAVCADLPGLGAGVYHFDPRGPALTVLRRGDYRRHLLQAGGEHPAIVAAPLILVYSDIFWRNAIKYQAREYRHAFWDSGTILSHTLAMAATHDLPAKIVTGFVDEEVNRLLELDTEREAALALLPVGRTQKAPPEPPALEPVSPATSGTGPPGPFPAILEMHRASSLQDAAQVQAWRGAPPHLPLPEPQGRLFLLEPAPTGEMAQDPLEPVIRRRGSSRRFRRRPIGFRELSTILSRATVAGVPADFTSPPALNLNHLHLIANSVEGLPAGTYRFHPGPAALELLQEGSFRNEAGQLALGQALGADAAANVYFLSPLAPVLERFGNRGYRAAQLEAAVSAGRIYLAAYAQELGASGLTFYDDAVTGFFAPQEGQAPYDYGVTFLIALGQPGRHQ